MGKAELVHGARVTTAERRQVTWGSFDLESLVREDHRVRAIWQVIESLDLKAFYARISSVEERAGRPATDPKILLALWIYATSEGIGSAHHVDRLCKTDAVYRWICGGVSMNQHTLSDFRTDYRVEVDGLMTKVIATLMHNGLLHLRRLAHDGMRVRASAGAASFRRKQSLHSCAEEARARIAELQKEIDEEPAASDTRRRKAQERAAKMREEAIAQALEELPLVEQAKERRATRDSKARTRDPKAKKGVPRASTTDPEARVMRMPDGGFRPAYNVQLATDTESRFIVGVDVTNVGSDAALLTPMLDDIERRTGQLPKEHLVDGGFNALAEIERAHQRGVAVYAPKLASRSRKTKSTRRDPPGVAAWRARMDEPATKPIYKLRAATAETVNADLRRWRGLDRFVVRGRHKVRACAVLSALTYNVLRWIELAPAA